MASRTSLKADEGLRRASWRAMSDALVQRRAELGEPELPRNSGKRRTDSKRALLEAIDKAGGKW